MIINHNMNAMNAHRLMTGNTGQSGKSMEKLSSGLRINRAGDDAAGLAISEKMRGQIRGLNQASRNAQDGISLIQTAEGALSETHSILQRMRELSVQGANTTNTLDDRKEIQKEMNELVDEIDRISTSTEFNSTKLLDGSLDSIKKASITAPVTTNNMIAVANIDLSGPSKVIDAAHNSVKIIYGGQEVELTGLTSQTYDGVTDGQKISDFANDLQKLIDNNDTLKGKVNVSGVQIDSNNATLTFTADKSLEIQQATTNSITLSDFSLSGAPLSFESKFKLQGTGMTYTAGTPFSVGTDGFLNITYNGQAQSISLTAASYIGTSSLTGVDALAEDLMQAINANTTLKGHMSAVNEDGKITFYSDKDLKVATGNSISAAFSSIGFASGTDAVENKPAVIDNSSTGTGEAVTLQIGANQGQTLDVNISKMDSSSIGSSLDNANVSAAQHYEYTVKGSGLTGNIVIDSAHNSFKLSYGGKDYTVNGLTTKTYASGTDTEMQAFVADIQEKINKQSDLAGGHIQVGYNSKGITFTGDKDFEVSSADTNSVTLSSQLGITSGSSAVEGVYKAEGKALASFPTGTAATDSLVVKYNGTAVELVLGAFSYPGNAGGLVDKVQALVNADSTLKGHVAVALIDNKMTFISDKEFSLTAVSTGAGTLTAASFGFTTAQAAVIQEKTGAAAADINATVQSLKVTDTSTGVGGILTKGGAQSAITVIDTAIKQVSSERSKLGAFQNRLEHTINNLGTASENLTSAESRIRDVDMAKEMMEFTKFNILSQAAQAMLAQANQQPQGVLQVLR